jgi:DNA-binding NtrC family response regulator
VGEYLELVGFEPNVVVSAEQARNNLKCSRYDVVVSDFNMPGETGFDLFRYVSSLHPETPFVLVTGCDELQLKRESMRMGIHAFISKPFCLDELRQTIVNLMERNKQAEVPCLDRPEFLKPTLKIAFCGDNEYELQILQRTLEGAGYRDTICASAFSGKDLLYALRSSEGELPDLILLDMLVLFVDGLETLEIIRRDANFQNMPVLLMTGSPEYAEVVLKKYPHLAIDGTLTKPLTVDSLDTLLSPYRRCCTHRFSKAGGSTYSPSRLLPQG